MTTQCTACHQTMACNPDGCWCMTLPAILPLNEGAGCYCRDCLLTKIHTYLDALSAKPIAEQLAIAAPYKQAPLQEGLDYHIEDGLMVLGRWYHLRRGACCGNGCRHCPYS
ncbi:DUF5522 domain-containing protein [Pseudoalteromonas xiamenensis]|uniref:Cysteine-rich CWC n=1 Tax=Pseudoalteromonas xiamenensis TaxID=882626 RepID=A0A975HM25_9GAMM|nr:DUF5522 domain-containing protein [Pseudoalteromonas xiamenensis]QTH72698.1 hypothetical protein J5O05_07920 [Pseudoalteromonas xiamenensis]